MKDLSAWRRRFLYRLYRTGGGGGGGETYYVLDSGANRVVDASANRVTHTP